MPGSLYGFDPDQSRSAALMRTNSSHSFGPRISRSASVPDVTGYYRPFDRVRPAWLSQPYSRPTRLQIQYPYRQERNKQMAENYWRDRFYFNSPLYKRGYTNCRRPFESEYGTHVYSYFVRYNGYSYDRKHPSFYRRYFYPVEDYYG